MPTFLAIDTIHVTNETKTNIVDILGHIVHATCLRIKSIMFLDNQFDLELCIIPEPKLKHKLKS